MSTDLLTPAGRIAIIGAGAFGRFALDSYRVAPDFTVLAVADPDEKALAEVDAQGTRLTPDWRSIMDGNEIEVVHIATPPSVRREIIRAAFDAGRSVFCEKPLALTLAAADELIALAADRQVTLGVDYVMRYQPAYRFLFLLNESQLAGKLRSISFQNFAQLVPLDHWFWDPEQSGGILVEHGVHFFDAYGHMAGEAVRVEGHRPRPEAIEARVWYQGGVYARYYHEFAFPLPVEWASGVSAFERGHVVIDGWIPTRIRGAVLAPALELESIAASAGLTLDIEAGEATRFESRFPDRENHYRRGLVAGMREVVRRSRDPSNDLTVTSADARKSLAVAIAAQVAAESGEQYS